MFGEHFDVPVVMTNDANAAAIGEMMYGAAKGCKDFIMITLGTGVGSGFVVNGRQVYGHDGFAGEFGHVCAIRGGKIVHLWQARLCGNLCFSTWIGIDGTGTIGCYG